jgi:hypothetical protein
MARLRPGLHMRLGVAQVWIKQGNGTGHRCRCKNRCGQCWLHTRNIAGGWLMGGLLGWVQEGLRWLALAWPALPDSV